MPRLRSGADTASASAGVTLPPSPSPPPPTEMAGGSSAGTPWPSPSTALTLGLGLGPPAADGSLKSPGLAPPPRRSLRLASGAVASGVASPTTTPASSAPAAGADGASSGSGSASSGRRKGRAQAIPAPVASPTSAGEFGGGGEVRVWGGGNRSGEAAFISLQSGSRVAKRSMELGVQMGGEMGLGSNGGGGAGGQVHDEMPHRNVDSSGKRRKIGMEIPYVSDSESDNDDDCILPGEDGSRMPVQLCAASDLIELNLFTMSMGRTDEGRMGDSVKTGKKKASGVTIRENDIPIDEHVHGQSSAIGESIELLASPMRSALGENHAGMYSTEEERRQKARYDVKGKGKLDLGNDDSGAGTGIGKFSPDSKGKAKMVVEESSLSVSSGADQMDLNSVISEEVQSFPADHWEPRRRERARQRAIEMAPRFAFFKADEDGHSDDGDDDDDNAEELEPVPDPQDWPGPFSTAMRIITDREAKLRARELNSSNLNKSANKVISWIPSKDRKSPLRSAPSLTSLCLQTLSNNAEAIESLAGIPDELKNRLLSSLCHSRKMNVHLLGELMCDNPVTVQLSECSWLSEDDFETIFGKCRTEILQLDLSGRCMPDYMLPATLAKVPNSMPLLKKISLKGNYRLSDSGLDTIISAAPSLSSLNLCECSLLTSTGIENLANKLSLVLTELYIDDCLNVDAMMILPSLQKIKHLEVLSMSGIQSVCNKFVNELIPVHGSNLKELAFAGCLQLTSSSIKTIAGNCPQLSSLDLRNLNRLRDSAMRHLRNGCRLIKKIKLQRNTFSDEAVYRFLEQSGGYLTELCLNNVEKAGNLTAYAIARNCSTHLEVLDLSFCRELTNEALGLIVDSCSSLRILKLFGCTQITDVFLKGHSNSLVTIVGIEGNILKQTGSL
uniref:F-box/LRR-repeat protein 15-like leucin rich repeat domain-containing protein n=1 Tax=Oryza rufipogon TaxID=4529 RepID=A0A0E0QJX7_ORYRU